MIKDFWKRLSQENATSHIQVKVQPVLKEFLKTHTNMSEYIRGLVIADYERQQAEKDGE